MIPIRKNKLIIILPFILVTSFSKSQETSLAAFSSGKMGTEHVWITNTEFEGREAFALENNILRISVLCGGGNIAELCMKSALGNELVNPLFIPHYPTIDPYNYTSEKHKDIYGSGNNARLMAGYMGHFLCFPYFGDMNLEQTGQAKLPTHGEAYTVNYDIEILREDKVAVIKASAVLPLTGFSIERSLSLMPGKAVVLVEETIENLKPEERTYQWVQHITFGPPFLEYEKTFADAPVAGIAFSPDEDDPLNLNMVEWPWIRTEDGHTFNSGYFSSAKGESGYRAWLLDPDREYTWLTVYNVEQKLLVGYLFRKEGNTWIGDWQENQRARGIPRNGKTVAWGLEVGTSPFPSGKKYGFESREVFNTESYGWIGSKKKKTQSYLIFVLEIDEGFKGVEEVHLEKGAIILTEKESSKRIGIANDFFIKQTQ